MPGANIRTVNGSLPLRTTQVTAARALCGLAATDARGERKAVRARVLRSVIASVIGAASLLAIAKATSGWSPLDQAGANADDQDSPAAGRRGDRYLLLAKTRNATAVLRRRRFPHLRAMQGKLEVPRGPSNVARAGLDHGQCDRSADRAQERATGQ